MKPMLAHVWEPHRVTYPCYIQPKFNGVRAVCGVDDEGRRRFQSRDELPWHPNVLRHLSDALDFLPKSVVLDGEIYRHGWSLQKINGACSVARTAPGEDTEGLGYMIFDVVDYTQSFVDRFWNNVSIHMLDSDRESPCQIATTYQVKNDEQVNSFYSRMVQQGFEGIMYRLGDCPYTFPKQAREGRGFLSDKNNRTWHLLKRKSWLDDEFIVLAVEEGEGKRQGKVGAFVCSAHNQVGPARFRVGSGLSDAEAAHYFLHPEQIVGKKIKVKFLTLTSSGVPFNPTFECIV